LGGEQQGQALLELFPDGATIFELEGTPGSSPAIDRSKGLHNIIDGVENIEVACKQTAEFRRDQRNGRFVLIEINPRTSLAQELITRSRLDIPLIAYADAKAKPMPPTLPVIAMRWIDFVSDFRAFRQLRKLGQITTWQWFESIISCRAFAYFCGRRSVAVSGENQAVAGRLVDPDRSNGDIGKPARRQVPPCRRNARYGVVTTGAASLVRMP
jgi:hypothetical protein